MQLRQYHKWFRYGATTPPHPCVAVCTCNVHQCVWFAHPKPYIDLANMHATMHTSRSPLESSPRFPPLTHQDGQGGALHDGRACSDELRIRRPRPQRASRRASGRGRSITKLFTSFKNHDFFWNICNVKQCSHNYKMFSTILIKCTLHFKKGA